MPSSYMSASTCFAGLVFLGLLLLRWLHPRRSCNEGFRDISGTPYFGSLGFAADPRMFIKRIRRQFPEEWIRFQLSGVSRLISTILSY
jgi:hypothetical protein